MRCGAFGQGSRTALTVAAEYGRGAVVEALLAFGMQVDSRSTVSSFASLVVDAMLRLCIDFW